MATGMPAYGVYLYDAIGGNYVPACTPNPVTTARSNIAASQGRYRLYVYPNAGTWNQHTEETGTFTAGQTVTHDVTFPASAITGTVRYADQTPVASLNVFARGLNPYGSIETFYASRTDENGNYAIFGVGAGPVTILAQDYNGLAGLGAGTIVNSATSLLIDITMLPTGRVQGVVTNGGTPIPNAWVELEPAIEGLSGMGTQADANGAFAFSRVPAVGFKLKTCYGQRCAEVAATLTTEGQVVTINLQIPPAAGISGVLLDTDTVTPVAGLSVKVQYRQRRPIPGDDQRQRSVRDERPARRQRLGDSDPGPERRGGPGVAAGRTHRESHASTQHGGDQRHDHNGRGRLPLRLRLPRPPHERRPVRR